MVLGVSLMAAQVFLMLAYLRYYLPMMAYKADPGPQTGQSEHAVGRDALLSYFGWVSLAASSIALLWFLVMMFYHFAEWEYTFNPVMR